MIDRDAGGGGEQASTATDRPMRDAKAIGAASVASMASVVSAHRDAYPLLLIDAGNSRVKWALLEHDGRRQAGGFFDRQWSADDEAPLLADWCPLPPPVAIWMSNVAGETVAHRIKGLVARRWPTTPVHQIRSCEAQCGVVNHYLKPSQLGSDRWAGMIGARAAYPGEAMLIATLGTATTLDALDADGHFVGGLIAPGWTLMMRSLGEHTAQLPTLTGADAGRLLDDAPSNLFAQDTATALAEGCRLAQVGLIETAWRTLSAHHHAQQDAGGTASGAGTAATSVRIVIGGGAAPEVVRSLTLPYTRHDDLVLEGLALIALSESSASAGG